MTNANRSLPISPARGRYAGGHAAAPVRSALRQSGGRFRLDTSTGGHLVPWEASTPHIATEAVLRGASVFEGIRAYKVDNDLVVFRLHDHLDRLYNTSMRFLRMRPAYEAGDLAEAIGTLMAANEVRTDAYIRVVAYFDEFRVGRELESGSGVFVIVREQMAVPRGSMRVTLSPWRRLNDTAMAPRVKASANYINSRIASVDAQCKGFDSAILLNDRDKVAEGPAMNLFLIRSGVLITPRVTDGILEGITRATVLDIARRNGIPVEEWEVDATELYVAEEMFFCGTAYEVTPIVENSVGDAKPGPLTELIRDAYFTLVRGRAPAPTAGSCQPARALASRR